MRSAMLWLSKTPLHWPQISSVHTTPTTRTLHRVKSTSKLVSVKPITASLTVHEMLLSFFRGVEWQTLNLIRRLFDLNMIKVHICSFTCSFYFTNVIKESLEIVYYNYYSLYAWFYCKIVNELVCKNYCHNNKWLYCCTDWFWEQLSIDHKWQIIRKVINSKREPRRKGSKEWVGKFAGCRMYIRAEITWCCKVQSNIQILYLRMRGIQKCRTYHSLDEIELFEK